MNDNTESTRLRETGWRRDLTAAEQAALRQWLAAAPDARPDWELDAALTRALQRLPDAPVASNFTARVVQAVQLEARPTGRFAWRPLRWLPRLAFAIALAAVVGGFGLHQYRRANREQLAHSVAAFTEVRTVPSPEILADFDAIYRLSPAPAADTELIALMK